MRIMETNTVVYVHLTQEDTEIAIRAYVESKLPNLCMSARGIDITSPQPWNFTVTIDTHSKTLIT